MNTVNDKAYDGRGRLIYARRSNVGLESDVLLPGPGWGRPRGNRALVMRSAQGPYDDVGVRVVEP